MASRFAVLSEGPHNLVASYYKKQKRRPIQTQITHSLVQINKEMYLFAYRVKLHQEILSGQDGLHVTFMRLKITNLLYTKK